MAEKRADLSVETGIPQKKGGKAVVVIALAFLLACGGYFGFQYFAENQQKPEAAKVKLGITVPLSEFLVNLQGNRTYARIEVALHLREGVGRESFDQCLPAVRDAIVLSISSKSLEDVSTPEGKVKLKGEIAQTVNRVLLETDPTLRLQAQGKRRQGAAPEPPEGWDSAQGPVLKVYFTSFATQ